MPNRLIRDGLLDSERYWSATIEARQMFVHLLLTADDFGCFNAANLFLRRRCFSESPTSERVEKLLIELVDNDLIRLYEANKVRYGFIPRFAQRLQRMTLKHPQPPERLYVDDSEAQAKFNKINGIVQNPSTGQRRPTVCQPPEVEVEVEVEEKKKKEKTYALGVAEMLIDVDPQTLADWKKIRTAKRLPITKSALEAIQREANKAGKTMNQALAICCEQSWAGFKADWLSSERMNGHSRGGATPAEIAALQAKLEAKEMAKAH